MEHPGPGVRHAFQERPAPQEMGPRMHYTIPTPLGRIGLEGPPVPAPSGTGGFGQESHILPNGALHRNSAKVPLLPLGGGGGGGGDDGGRDWLPAMDALDGQGEPRHRLPAHGEPVLVQVDEDGLLYTARGHVYAVIGTHV